MSEEFKDWFSARSIDYSAFRPDYPHAMIKWLVDQSPRRDLAFDGATGSGQTARALAPFFKRVVASDASSSQIDNAAPCEGVEYRVARCEASGLDDHSVDLLTIAQAAHWLDMEAFNKEVARVMKKEGIVAIWCYQLLRTNTGIDALIDELFADILGDKYWPPERALVEQGYQSLAFPFEEVTAPNFDMCASWSLDHLIGYLGTWSAVQRYKDDRGEDPVARIGSRLQAAWEKGDPVKQMSWPVSMRAGRCV